MAEETKYLANQDNKYFNLGNAKLSFYWDRGIYGQWPLNMHSEDDETLGWLHSHIGKYIQAILVGRSNTGLYWSISDFFKLREGQNILISHGDGKLQITLDDTKVTVLLEDAANKTEVRDFSIMYLSL